MFITTMVSLPLKNYQYGTFQYVYVPTLQVEHAEKDKFYSEVRSRLQSNSADDKIIILGESHARGGKNADTWKGELGSHGVGGFALSHNLSSSTPSSNRRSVLKQPGYVHDPNTGTS